MSTKKQTNWKTISAVLGLLVWVSLQTGCSRAAPTVFVTGSDYISLNEGQVFTATRDMVLATESVIQKKDEQILDLIRVNEKLVRELELSR